MKPARRSQRQAARIVSNPHILSGKPVLKGTRLPVELVLKALTADPTMKELFAAYPHLDKEDVAACLEYAQRIDPFSAKQPATFPSIRHRTKG